MLHIHGRNVNECYHRAVVLMGEEGEPEDSRNGGVLVAPYPVMSVYQRPTERVLFGAVRDANPFFHLFESVWMLAGQEDATWLDTWVRDFSARYAEQDGHMHGAYGFRWRSFFGMDQLEECVNRLRANPGDRQAVITMWDPTVDLEVSSKRDRPCNTQIYLRVRDGELDLTVTCRSNDIVWGAYGANAVHFSFLQEYLAAAIGVEVGTMYQLSNNWHVYQDVWEQKRESEYSDHYTQAIDGVQVSPRPMVTMPQFFLEDCERFVRSDAGVYANPWFAEVAEPMRRVHATWREGRTTEAVMSTDRIQASDWQLAARQWLDRRISREERKNG